MNIQFNFYATKNKIYTQIKPWETKFLNKKYKLMKIQFEKVNQC